MSDNEESIMQFKNEVAKAKTQTFTESIINSFYFFYVISYFGRYFNNQGYQLAWYLIEHPDLIKDN